MTYRLHDVLCSHHANIAHVLLRALEPTTLKTTLHEMLVDLQSPTMSITRVTKAVRTLENVDTAMASTTKLDPAIVIQMGQYQEAADILSQEAAHKGTWLNICHQRVLLAYICVFRCTQNWDNYTRAISNKHFDCITSHKPCECLDASNGLNYSMWMTKLVLNVSNKLHSGRKTAWTISSEDFLPQLTPPVTYTQAARAKTATYLSERGPLADATANTVQAVMSHWLGFRCGKDWYATAQVLNIVLQELGTGAFLLPCIWDAYKRGGRALGDSESNIRRGYQMAFTTFSSAIMLTKDALKHAGLLERLENVQAAYNNFIKGSQTSKPTTVAMSHNPLAQDDQSGGSDMVPDSTWEERVAVATNTYVQSSSFLVSAYSSTRLTTSSLVFAPATSFFRLCHEMVLLLSSAHCRLMAMLTRYQFLPSNSDSDQI